MPLRMYAARHGDAIDVLSTFEEGMIFIKVVLHAIILTAQAVLMSLDNLGARVSVLGDIVVREGLVAAKARDELLAELWPFFGANRGESSACSKCCNTLAAINEVR